VILDLRAKKPLHVHNGQLIDGHLFDSTDMCSLNLANIKEDAQKRGAVGELNAFSVIVFSYAQSIMKLSSLSDADLAMNEAIRSAIEPKMKAMKLAGLTDDQIASIPPANDPRWN
jgi:hypothetical protein